MIIDQQYKTAPNIFLTASYDWRFTLALLKHDIHNLRENQKYVNYLFFTFYIIINITCSKMLQFTFQFLPKTCICQETQYCWINSKFFCSSIPLRNYIPLHCICLETFYLKYFRSTEAAHQFWYCVIWNVVTNIKPASVCVPNLPD